MLQSDSLVQFEFYTGFYRKFWPIHTSKERTVQTDYNAVYPHSPRNMAVSHNPESRILRLQRR